KMNGNSIGCAFCARSFETAGGLVQHAAIEDMDRLRRPDTTTKQTVLLNFVLDKSGKMAPAVYQSIRGLNQSLEEFKKVTGVDSLFCFTLFDTYFENRYVGVPLERIDGLNRKNYQPDGWTALYDAIGTTIEEVDRGSFQFDKVVTVIMTDGHENSSRE